MQALEVRVRVSSDRDLNPSAAGLHSVEHCVSRVLPGATVEAAERRLQPDMAPVMWFRVFVRVYLSERPSIGAVFSRVPPSGAAQHACSASASNSWSGSHSQCTCLSSPKSVLIELVAG